MFETWTLAVLRRQEQLVGDLLVRTADGEQADDLRLAGGQPEGGCGIVLRRPPVFRHVLVLEGDPGMAGQDRDVADERRGPEALAVERAERRAYVAAFREPRDASCAAPSR